MKLASLALLWHPLAILVGHGDRLLRLGDDHAIPARRWRG